PENSAEHSWHLALMVPILVSYFECAVDQLKVIKMLLIHDLGEISVGDTWVYDKLNRSSPFKSELQAFKELVSVLPENQQNDFVQLFIEFEKQESNEAKFAKVLDAIQPLINHLYVSDENENPDSIQLKMVLEKKGFIKSIAPKLWSLTEEIIHESVQKGLYKST
ncbi:MAG: HD domain-containing protein, partial [Bacteroidetes bacterium]|nr:HD domain-containing protein [Bacteroidota bacterium]